MAKFSVIKEFVNKKGSLYKEGDTFDAASGKYINGLVRHGFIKEIPEKNKVELSGQYIDPLGGPAYSISASATSTELQSGLLSASVAKLAATIGVSFRTKQEAQSWIEYQKAYQILRQDAKGFKPNWKDLDQPKWFGFYDHYKQTFKSDFTFGFQDEGKIYFESKADICKSLHFHCQEWLTVFGVEE